MSSGDNAAIDIARQEGTHRMYSGQATNVGQMERWASIAAGAGLVLMGLRRGPLRGILLTVTGGGLLYRGLTGHCPGYASLGFSTAEPSLEGVPAQHGYRFEYAIRVNAPPEQLYRFWRRLENLPRIMQHLVEVRQLDERRSHWTATAPLGRTISWEAEIINEREGEMIAWASLPGSQMDTAGSVHFDRSPDGHGTLLSVSLKYNPPAGKLGARVADLLGEGLERQVREDLSRFKQTIESGQLPSEEQVNR